jgi:hypothetical protein
MSPLPVFSIIEFIFSFNKLHVWRFSLKILKIDIHHVIKCIAHFFYFLNKDDTCEQTWRTNKTYQFSPFYLYFVLFDWNCCLNLWNPVLTNRASRSFLSLRETAFFWSGKLLKKQILWHIFSLTSSNFSCTD